MNLADVAPHWLALIFGILLLAAAVAVRLAWRLEFRGKTIVTVLPDSGERYLSSTLFEGIFNAQGAAL